MFLVEQELRGQFKSIEKTVEHILKQKQEIANFLADAKAFCVAGCGSSYYTAKSTAMQLAQRTGAPSFAAAGGDLLVNFESYNKLLEQSILILLSRSGSTTEMLRLAENCRKHHPGMKILSICAVEGAPIAALADINIEIPWAFDRAVCQTQTVSNLYISGLLLAAIKSGDDDTQKDIRTLNAKAAEFVKLVETPVQEAADWAFENVVVLADSGMAGLAEEGALAFKEICHRQSNFYNVLDVRHGPILTIADKTLVIVLVSRGNLQLQTDLVLDVAKRAGRVLALFCPQGAKVEGENIINVQLPQTIHDDVSALFMLYNIQLLCLKHALFRGVDPDKPEGLAPWIELKV